MPLFRRGWCMSAAGLGLVGLAVLGVLGMVPATLPAASPAWSQATDGAALLVEDEPISPVSIRRGVPVASHPMDGPDEAPLLRRALDDLDRVLAGAVPVERSPAAPAAGPRSPDVVQLRRAEQEVAQARAALRRAREAQEQLLELPGVSERRVAQRELAAARAMVLHAEADVARLSGPDPVVLAAAERKVQRAEATLLATMAPRSLLAAAGDRTSSPGAQEDPSVHSARLALQEAIARRDLARAGPPAWELEQARARLLATRLSAEVAAQRLEATGSTGATRSAEDARVAVLSARIALDDAEARLRILQEGVP